MACRVTATAPTDWVASAGPHAVRFFHDGLEFRPSASATTDAYSDYDMLRSAEYAPRECPGAHALPDPTGGTCVCAAGYERDASTADADTLSCLPRCGNGTALDTASGQCTCPRNTYDVRRTGVLLCATGGWSNAVERADYAGDMVKLASDGSVCLPCAECADCEGGVATLREGWRLNATDGRELNTLLRSAAATTPQFAFRCPSEAYEVSTCPPLRLEPNGSECQANHTGRLCNVCEEGFSRRSKEGTCVPCTNYDQIEADFGMPVGWFVLLLCACDAFHFVSDSTQFYAANGHTYFS